MMPMHHLQRACVRLRDVKGPLFIVQEELAGTSLIPLVPHSFPEEVLEVAMRAREYQPEENF
jgi:hypothetical protein